MKKLLFLCLILISCEKDDTFCWKCRRDVWTPGTSYSVVVKVCDMSEEEQLRFEKTNSSINGTTTISMKCWKEGEEPER